MGKNMLTRHVEMDNTLSGSRRCSQWTAFVVPLQTQKQHQTMGQQRFVGLWHGLSERQKAKQNAEQNIA